VAVIVSRGRGRLFRQIVGIANSPADVTLKCAYSEYLFHEFLVINHTRLAAEFFSLPIHADLLSLSSIFRETPQWILRANPPNIPWTKLTMELKMFHFYHTKLTVVHDRSFFRLCLPTWKFVYYEFVLFRKRHVYYEFG
jgi:hypothetical protein